MRRNFVFLAASISVAAFAAAAPNGSEPSAQVAAPAVEAAAVATGIPTAAASAAPIAVPAREGDARRTAVDNALAAFAGRVHGLSADNALEVAFDAYFAYKAAHPQEVRKPYLYFVDYGLDNRTPRGYVFDMEKLRVVEGPFTVAHGRGSSKGYNGVPFRFSNESGSAASSLGLYVTQETYDFSGHSAGRLYTSIGLRMKGVSGAFNSAARARGVVVHGAPYVTSQASGRSEGCPAMEQTRARRLIPMLAQGSVVFLYSPNDASWLRNDPWVNAD